MSKKNEKIEYALALETSAFNRSVKLAAGSVDKMSKDITRASKKAGKSLSTMTSNFATAGVLAAGVVGAAFVAVGIDALASASDLEETQGKFDVVFKGITDSAEAWSQELQNKFILTEQESKRHLSSLQDLLVPTGMARDDAGEMSFEFVKLAADLASFNNLDTADVVRDIASALQGSSDTMAKYGVNVKAAKIEHEILTQGWAKSKEEITDAMKAQALMNITMRQTADAQGDLERTSGSYANQMRLAQKNVNDLSTAFGEGLLPAVNKGVTAFNRMFDEADVKEWGFQSAIAVLEFAADTLEGMNSVYKVFNNLNGVLRLSQAGFMMLTKGIQYLFEQSNRMFGDTEKAEYWAQAQVEAQKTIESAFLGADNAFNKALSGIPALDTIAGKIRTIKDEIKKDTIAEKDNALIPDAEAASSEIVKIGDTWTVVSKEIAAKSAKTWGEIWLDFQNEAEKGTAEAEDDIDALMAKIKATAGPHKITFEVTEAHKNGGPVGLGFNTGGTVPGGWGGGDRVRAMLEPGEFVLRKEAVRHWGLDRIAEMNRLAKPVAMQQGGPVQSGGSFAVTINWPQGTSNKVYTSGRSEAETLLRNIKRMGDYAA